MKILTKFPADFHNSKRVERKINKWAYVEVNKTIYTVIVNNIVDVMNAMKAIYY